MSDQLRDANDEAFNAAMRAFGWPERMFGGALTRHERDIRDAAFTGWCAALEHPKNEGAADQNVAAALGQINPEHSGAAQPVRVEPRFGPRMTAALLAAAKEALEFVEGQEDVIDGPYGNPRPNKAMQVAMSLRAVIGAAIAKGPSHE